MKGLQQVLKGEVSESDKSACFIFDSQGVVSMATASNTRLCVDLLDMLWDEKKLSLCHMLFPKLCAGSTILVNFLIQTCGALIDLNSGFDEYDWLVVRVEM